jgi:ribonuclease T
MSKISERFRQFLPIVVDVETGGLNPAQDALLELAAVTITMDDDGLVRPNETFHYHILAAEGTTLDPKALAFNKIDPTHPLRFAEEEKQALASLFEKVSAACKKERCQRAVLVGHNAWFDQQFLNAAVVRTGLWNPFHRFTSFDTATLAGLFFGQTVLAKALEMAKIPFDLNEAHSALYDATSTAELFCYMVNRFKGLGGF